MSAHGKSGSELLPGMELTHRVAEFYYREADILDDRKFGEWLELLEEDIRYWVPLAWNINSRDKSSQYTREQLDPAWMDEGKETLRQRVQQLSTGIHWAEEPISRTSHLITNVRVLEVTPGEDATEIRTSSRFLVYRNRVEDEVDIYVGKRVDTLLFDGNSFSIKRREVYLDQNVLLAKNITTFF